MRIYDIEGFRTFRRGYESVRIARALVGVCAGLKRVGAWEVTRGCWFADVVNRLRTDDAALGAMSPPASYQAIERCLPFEHEGVVYRVKVGGKQGRMYDKTKGLVFEAGSLADLIPGSKAAPKSLKSRVAAAVAEKVAEVEPFANLYAMREEARRYMDARLSALEARVAELEKAALM